MAQSARNYKPSPFLWALDNLEKGNENDFVEFLDIKEKDSYVHVSSLALAMLYKHYYKM